MDRCERYDRAIRRQQEFGLSWEEAMHPYADHPTGAREHFRLKYPLPSPLPDVAYSETSLKLEHERQAVKLAQRYAKRLGLSEEEYIGSLPSFPDKPHAKGLGARPVIVEGIRIPWREQAMLSGIAVDKDIPDDLIIDDIITLNPVPQKPFSTWILHFNPSWWRNCEIELGSRPASILEGIAYWNAYDYLVNGNLLFLQGSRIPSDPHTILYMTGQSVTPCISSLPEEERMKHLPVAFLASFVHLFAGRDIRT